VALATAVTISVTFTRNAAASVSALIAVTASLAVLGLVEF
jgi:hypothetical protein